MYNLHPLIDEIPNEFYQYVTNITDVVSDGNCGFRAIAVSLGYNEDYWPQISTDLYNELLEHPCMYERIYEHDFNMLSHMLNFNGTDFAPAPYWMIMPDTGFLIANRNTLPMSFYFVVLSSLSHPSHGVFFNELAEPIALKQTAKTSHLHFFLHDIHSGKTPSAIKIVGTSEPSHFGDTYIMDNALTEGRKVSSKAVGKARGMYAIAARKDADFLMVMNLEFTHRELNGSSVSVLGRNPIAEDVREMPIVGGSGRFRYASGYALAHTVWSDPKTFDGIVEYNVYLNHY